MSTPVWAARTGSGLQPGMLDYSESVAEDRPFLVHDLAGSSAHVLGLRRAGLLSADEAGRLLAGLRSVLAAHEAGALALDPALEDVHMNIEARLTAELGDVGARLHTGRSRNDQVATCIVLHARTGLAGMAGALHQLSAALAEQAARHAKTPWVARTHGQAAQPATLGFLLAAHAHRVQDAERAVLGTFDGVGESPLGMGAVAGSTLPLDPAFTARLLGLRPPRNALLSTGTRDTVLWACGAAAQAGHAMSSLAQDLLDLFAAGRLRLPEGYTTGSSLMPQKRNPDALELARGRARGLAGPLAAVTAVTAGLPLGYHRDFQLTKPPLHAALSDATATAEILCAVLAGADFAGPDADWGKPGLVATDVAEALVRTGMPFRTAYTVVARAMAAVEGGLSLPEALAQAELAPAELEAALAACQPDPARRKGLGGPAPAAVAHGLAAHASAHAALEAGLVQAQRDAERPMALLSRPIADLLEEP